MIRSQLAPARRERISVGTFGATALAAAAALVFAASARAECKQDHLPVALGENKPKQSEVRVQLCRGPRLPDTVQVLLAGATEGGLAHWDFPGPDPYASRGADHERLRDRYSYVKYLEDAGLSSLTLDRIGTGGSSHPPAEEVTIAANAHVLHQMVQELKGEGTVKGAAFGGAPFERVVTVGRSLSGPVTYMESVIYRDVEGVVTQSFRRHQQPPFFTFPQTFQPAQLDPRFADLPPGYMTTRPGTRALFYAPDVETRVREVEEETKETLTDGEAATFGPSFQFSEQVEVPVLSIVGELDSLFCTAPGCPEAAQEKDFFPRAKCFESHVVLGAGHDMNLEPDNRRAAFPLIARWVERNFADNVPDCSEDAP